MSSTKIRMTFGLAWIVVPIQASKTKVKKKYFAFIDQFLAGITAEAGKGPVMKWPKGLSFLSVMSQVALE